MPPFMVTCFISYVTTFVYNVHIVVKLRKMCQHFQPTWHINLTVEVWQPVISVCCDVSAEQAWYFDRDDVGLKGFHKFFKKSSCEEREHAEKMMKYQNLRGGRLVLQPIDVRCHMFIDQIRSNT